MRSLCSRLWLLLSLAFASMPMLANEIGSPDKTKPTIVALAPHIVEILYAIGADEQIIATLEHANYPDAAKRIPRVGNYASIQIERLVEYQPDLVISWRSGNPSAALARLESMGFRVVDSSPNSPLSLTEEIKKLGRLSGHEKAANALAERYQKQLTRLREQYKSAPALTYFYEIWATPLTTIARGAWPYEALTLCGLQNPFADAAAPYPQVSMEQVLNANPDVIIQPVSDNEPSKAHHSWSDWPQLQAVKAQAIVQPNADTLHRMTPRLLNSLVPLCAQVRSF